ncbi:hypothetical protein QFZ40_004354 [Arthrobacter pascens]|uniref:STAS/SEC14 domain-containing protein n=1 Tax=Arthrobacter pascens TaxID=1677 RepID=UPI002781436D|nr:STAS/SEC14 domain-containing protein [Arthrobacter pascens]MDQ0636383.1 hypothetical protein [Arthrobacter pascens]
MTHQTLAGDDGAVELSGGVLYLRWSSGAVVTEEDARAVTSKVSALCSSRPRPMLVDVTRIGGLEHRARTVFAGAWPLTRVAVVGASPVDRVIVDFYVARHSPVCPTKFFASFADAMKWLGVHAGQVKTPQSGLLTAWDTRHQPVRGGSRGDRDADMMLTVLLKRTEGIISDTQAVANGMPLFVVEAELTQRLQAVLPGVRFTAQDIRAWAAEISS